MSQGLWEYAFFAVTLLFGLAAGCYSTLQTIERENRKRRDILGEFRTAREAITAYQLGKITYVELAQWYTDNDLLKNISLTFDDDCQRISAWSLPIHPTHQDYAHLLRGNSVRPGQF